MRLWPGSYSSFVAQKNKQFTKTWKISIKYFLSLLTLFVPAYFDVSGTRGGHIVPPLNIFGLGRVRVPILLGNYLPRSYLQYTKGFIPKKFLTFETFVRQRGV